MASSTRPYESFAGEYTVAWIDHLADTGDDTSSCALHDPLAVAAVTLPDLISFQRAYLEVETGDGSVGPIHTDLGARSHHLNADADGVAMGYSPNAHVAVDVNPDGFLTHFRTLMARL